MDTDRRVSLDFDTSKVLDADSWQLNWDSMQDELNPITLSIIHAAPAIAMNKLTKHNAKEWYWRIQFLKLLGVGWRYIEQVEINSSYDDRHFRNFYPTYYDLKDRAGLFVDVEPLTRKKWLKTQYAHIDGIVDRAVERTKKEKRNGNESC